MHVGKRLAKADSAPKSGEWGRVPLLPRGSRLLVAAILLFVATEAAFLCSLPLGVRYFLETVLKTRDRPALESLSLLLGGALVAALGCGFLRDFLFARLQSRSLAGLRQNMFRRLQNLSLQFHSELDKRQMRERFSGELATVENAFSLAISWGILPLTISLLATGLMFRLDWRVGLSTVVLWPWALLAPRAMTPKTAQAAHKSRLCETDVLRVVDESLSAVALIRAFAIEHLGAAAFRSRNEALARSTMTAVFWAAIMERFTSAGILFGQVFVLGLSLWLVFAGSMSVGTMVSLQMLAVLLGSSLLYIVEYLPVLVSAQEAFGGIQGSLHETEAITDAHDARVLPPFGSEIVFSNVSFICRDRASHSRLADGDDAEVTPVQRALVNVNLRIPKGCYAAFVGPSGAGKSAMLNLMLRFHDPANGRVTIDGHDLRHVTQASLRAQTGVVLQDSFVFNSTIRENIRMGLPAATEDAIAGAAAAAGMIDFIRAQPQGFDTPAGSGGIRLCGEMTQRLALARAILRQPPVLLLDEIASALDPAEERAVNATLAELAKSTTLITVTHRLASAADAGRIFVFDRGEVVEQGSHFELMATEGTYANLWRKQAGFRYSADGRHVDVDADRLRAIPILEKLPEPILAELAPCFATETFPAGRDIVCQNDPGDKFYIIARGKVEVWRTEEQSGRTLCVNVLNDGDFFGEITLITGFPRTATIRTVAVTTCLSLGRGQFTKLIDRLPELKQELSEIAIQRLRNSSRLAAEAR
jgi:ATP-binding cassette subfamily B protein